MRNNPSTGPPARALSPQINGSNSVNKPLCEPRLNDLMEVNYPGLTTGA